MSEFSKSRSLKLKMDAKECTKCKKIKKLEEFSRDSGRRDGRQVYCKSCFSLYRTLNKEKIALSKKEYRRKNKDFISLDQSIRYLKNIENRKAYAANHGHVYKKKNRVQIAAKKLKWRKSKPGKYASYCAQSRAAKLKATPKWLTKNQLKEIESFYVLAKEIQWLSEEKLEVDHIVPLQGKNVCGLNVPWNLQILPKGLNSSKSNKLKP